MTKNEWLRKNVRVKITGGEQEGRTGRAVRPDGQLHGENGWLIKMDHKMGGTFVPTKFLTPEND